MQRLEDTYIPSFFSKCSTSNIEVCPRLACPTPILVTMQENQAAVLWALEAGPGLPGRLNHDQISLNTSKEKGHLVRRCVAFSAWTLQRGQK
jgi:hypothetical protein